LNSGGDKATGGNTNLDGILTLANGDNFDVDHIFTLGQTSGDESDISGTLNVNSNGGFVLDDGGAAQVQVSSGGVFNLLDPGPGNAGYLTLLNGTQFEVIGTFDNDDCERTNMAFAPTSTVVYNGQLNVVTTVETNAYGNLTLTGSAGGNYIPSDDGCLLTSPNIYLATDLTIEDASLEMANENGWTDGSGGYLYMYGGNVNYTQIAEDNDIGVIGKMQREVGAGAYTMNNDGTTITMTTGPGTWVGIAQYPGQTPGQWNTTSPDGPVIDRMTILSADDNAAVFSQITVGYVDAEDQGLTDAQKARLLMYEGYDVNEDGDLTIDATGSDANDELTNVFGVNGTFTLAAAGAAGTPTTIYNSADLFASYTGVFSITDGRWSDPNTWVNDWTPIATDDVEIRHVVFTGYDGVAALPSNATYQYAVNEQTLDDIDDLGGGVYRMAKSVTVTEREDLINYGTDRAFVIGNDDSDMAQMTFKIGDITNVDDGLFTSNTSPGNWTFNWGDAGRTNELQGLYLWSCLNPDYEFDAILRVARLTNLGTIVNRGVIELGD
jgi:hypothetical protein